MKSLLLRSVKYPHFNIFEPGLHEHLKYGFSFVLSIDHHAPPAELTQDPQQYIASRGGKQGCGV